MTQPPRSSVRKAIIYSVTTPTGIGYGWKWRCAETKVESAATFPFYYDCVADAQIGGLEVELTHAVGATAPGGARYDLQEPARTAPPPPDTK
jgi:hypothetical protein